MPNGPERQALIDRMVEILRHDAPWVYMLYPKDYTLAHAWVYNRKPNKMANNGLKYQRVDPRLRQQKRAEWNHPVVWPVAATLAALALALAAGGAVVPQARTCHRQTGNGMTGRR